MKWAPGFGEGRTQICPKLNEWLQGIRTRNEGWEGSELGISFPPFYCQFVHVRQATGRSSVSRLQPDPGRRGGRRRIWRCKPWVRAIWVSS